ncbi:phosphoenolpyruvate--protein phosphotransferase [Ligaoa zhengdingensis]|uniref:phosphoenolpyruvate--protein phosphotransferase n=1 Tax=Ligaoa zhengdingensis TaxID=2763658 RepID=UPI0031BB7DBD
MKVLQGIGASPGIAIGRLFFFMGAIHPVERQPIENPPAEIERFEAARQASIDSLHQIYERALEEIGPKDSAIFQIHAMLLDDLDYVASVTQIIQEEHVNAEYAVYQTAMRLSDVFSSIDDDYMRQRGADVLDISKRLLRTLTGAKEQNLDEVNGQVIIAADDLMPSETIRLDQSKALAFVTREGSRHSHTAILARTMGIPAVVGLEDAFDCLADRVEVIVDGVTGEVCVEPDAETLERYIARRGQYLAACKRLAKLRDQPSITKDGVRVEITANVGSIGDVEIAVKNGAEGIGLFRSEGLYLGRNEVPTEGEQFVIYREALERMPGKRVIIRTLDLGADKRAPCLGLLREDNPAMGSRAIRYCLSHPALFRTQLRALLRASVYGHLALLIPMVTSLEEVHRTKALIEEIKRELDDEGIPYANNYEFGVMIETPAAAMISDHLAQEVDFFSVGTNDLTQYTLATDRTNRSLSALYSPRHPAVLGLVRMAVENGRRHGVWTGVCGESATDPDLIPVFLSMGVAELSVAPPAILDVREKVRALDLTKARLDGRTKGF